MTSYKTNITDHYIMDDKFNIVDILLLDHRYLKKCIEILKDENADKKDKLKYGRSFLDTLKHHSEAEKKTVYTPLKDLEVVHSNILEGEIEHAIADAKVRALIPKLSHARSLSEELQAELKVLAELVEHHVKEEEREMIPKFRKELDSEILNQIGWEFMKLRGFTAKDLQDYPDLQEEITQWKGGSHRVSSLFLNNVHQHVNNMTH
jgi:hemerythrin-like domain-containing protein